MTVYRTLPSGSRYTGSAGNQCSMRESAEIEKRHPETNDSGQNNSSNKVYMSLQERVRRNKEVRVRISWRG